MKFYTTTQNSRNKTVKAGSHRGQVTWTWTHGVQVKSLVYNVNTKNPVEHFEIYMTHGSGQEGTKVYLDRVELNKKGQPKFIRAKKWQVNNETK